MRIAIKTLGCKINQYDSSVIQERLERERHSFVPFDEPADVYVINTCTVTDRADWEARHLVRHAKSRAPAARVLVTGCYAQVKAREVAQVPGVDFVVGLNRLEALVEFVQRSKPAGLPRIDVGDPREETGVRVLGARRFEGHTRAFLKVQEGCNFACTYCIIPTARGRSRSVPVEVVLQQVRELAAAGFVEIVLTGIHLGGYGHDLRPRSTLADLVERIAASGLISRLRLSSLDPREASGRLLQLMAGSDVVCPHLHVCVQAGNDKILRQMRRNYDRAYFKDLTWRARDMLPDAALGTDLMVGFPGESEEEFDEALGFFDALPLTYYHVFPYSSRTGTLAANLSGQVDHRVKKQRAQRARGLGARKREEFARSQLGRWVSVLVETVSRGDEAHLKGYTRNYLPVRFPGSPRLINREVQVKLERWAQGTLWGAPMGEGRHWTQS